MEVFDSSLWFMTPVAVLFATTAMSAGISASNFWLPMYIMGLGFSPAVAFWLSLATMMFGYGSGSLRNTLSKQVDWPFVWRCMIFCGPAACLGGYVSPYAPQSILLLLFGCFVLVYGSYMLIKGGTADQAPTEEGVPWKVGIPAAFLQGLVATGLGKLLLPRLLANKRFEHHATAVGSVVLITFLSSLCALLSRMNGPLLDTLSVERQTLISVLIWVAPGVILGGQLGPLVAKRIPRRYIKTYVGSLLILVGLLILARALR